MRAPHHIEEGVSGQRKISMESEPKSDTERGFEEIRKEVVESRNLVIKTDNLLKNLHAELKLVSKRQEEIAKKGWVGSAVAYGLFSALALVGSVMVANARVSSAREEVAGLTKQTHA